jgi:hypothetical protein
MCQPCVRANTSDRGWVDYFSTGATGPLFGRRQQHPHVLTNLALLTRLITFAVILITCAVIIVSYTRRPVPRHLAATGHLDGAVTPNGAGATNREAPVHLGIPSPC